jgi:hypothetical protein
MKYLSALHISQGSGSSDESLWGGVMQHMHDSTTSGSFLCLAAFLLGYTLLFPTYPLLRPADTSLCLAPTLNF